MVFNFYIQFQKLAYAQRLRFKTRTAKQILASIIKKIPRRSNGHFHSPRRKHCSFRFQIQAIFEFNFLLKTRKKAQVL